MQNNICKNAESLLKNLTEINKFESKATKHGTAMNLMQNYKQYQYLKNLTKKFISTNPGLKVDQIYPYIAASRDLLVTCHCCENRVVKIKCPYSACETVLSEEKLDYLIKDVDK